MELVHKRLVKELKGEELNQYLLDNSSLLFDYYNTKKTVYKLSDLGKPKKTSYHSILENRYQVINADRNPDYHFEEMPDEQLCPNCGEKQRLNEDQLVCLKCAIFIDHVEINNLPEHHYNKQTQRIQCFGRFIESLTGQSSQEIPDKIINICKKEMKLTGTMYPNEADIHSYLKKHKLPLYYNRIFQIIFVLTGQHRLDITPEQEYRIKETYSLIQNPYAEVVTDRTHFCNSSYIFYKICQHLDYEHLLFMIKLPKREVLISYERTWERLCKVLNWDFIPV